MRGEDSLDLFMKEVNKYPVLSKEEEHRIAKEYQKTGNAKVGNKLVTANLRYVVKVAHKYKSYKIPLSDLVQEGSMGLMKAVEKFDPKRGYKFISYGTWWIHAFIRNYILKTYSLVKIGTTQAQRLVFYNTRSKRASLEAQHGREITNEELAEELGVKVEELVDMEARMAFRDYSIDAPITPHGAQTFSELVFDKDAMQADEAIELKQRTIKLHAAIEVCFPLFNAKERLIVRERLLSEEPPTLQALGNRMKVSRERMRQLETRVKGKLREALVV